MPAAADRVLSADMDSQATTAGRDGAFPKTRWSVVLEVGSDDAARSLLALGQLCRSYWYPLYAYARRDGHSPQDAEDLVQGFFMQLLSKEHLKHVSRERGKLRSYLLSGLRNYTINAKAKEKRLKRGGGMAVESLDAQDTEARYRMEPLDEETPEKVFAQRWAVTILERATERLLSEYSKAGKGELFEQLKGFIGGRAETGSYTDVAGQLDMNEGAIKVAVHRLRKRYQNYLRDEVAQTVASAVEVDEELHYLFSVFS